MLDKIKLTDVPYVIIIIIIISTYTTSAFLSFLTFFTYLTDATPALVHVHPQLARQTPRTAKAVYVISNEMQYSVIALRVNPEDGTLSFGSVH